MAAKRQMTMAKMAREREVRERRERKQEKRAEKRAAARAKANPESVEAAVDGLPTGDALEATPSK